ncbi:hypothetical protein B7R22_08995 [Subtercola boreus]|uniref:SMP-30/Gluconolactonase/LRE-like region domain-containing protein n=1 Tax=Subtercola boreus TaxID=120213 RepID=A0A3E0VZT0_9MICO|nr:hypothetical protein [Subtercola boreus]RFA14838.1 hypothetical protein B7R22_08995 [Subtercola boreus]
MEHFALANTSWPTALVESRGAVYCSNDRAGTISKISGEGKLTETFASFPLGSKPIALSADTRGRLYALDWRTGDILVVLREGGTAVRFASVPPETLPFSITREYRGVFFIWRRRA